MIAGRRGSARNANEETRRGRRRRRRRRSHGREPSWHSHPLPRISPAPKGAQQNQTNLSLSWCLFNLPPVDASRLWGPAWLGTMGAVVPQVSENRVAGAKQVVTGRVSDHRKGIQLDAQMLSSRHRLQPVPTGLLTSWLCATQAASVDLSVHHTQNARQ